MPHTGYRSAEPYGYCDRCAEVVRLHTMRKEWTGFMVCPPCYDPRPPYLDAPNVYPEGLPLPDARPEPPDVEVGDNDIQPEDL